MTVDPYVLLLGIALLWFPRHWMRKGAALLKNRRRSTGSERILEPWKDREPGDPKVSFGVEFSKFRNYVDLVRGMAGGLAIWGGMSLAPAIVLQAGAGKTAAYQVLALRAFIVLVGLVAQAVRYEKARISFFPPIFFLAGLSVALCGYAVAGFAFVMIWVVNAGLPNAQAFLTAYAVLLVAFSALLSSPTSIPVMLAGFLAFLPVLLSLLAKRPLVIFARKGSRRSKPA